MRKPKGQSVLGRGLDSLIPQGPADTLTAGTTEIDIDRITPNRYQPRETFSPDTLDDLAQSIRENGIIQPLVLRRQGDDFQIVAGERRWRAAQLAGLKRVPAVIKNVTDERLLEIALVENIQRQDLTALETAKALRLLIEEHAFTQEELASRVGMKRPTLANYLRLLSLPDLVREALESGRIEMGHARALAGLSDAGEQVRIAQLAIQSSLTVRQVEALAQRAKEGPPASPVRTAPERRDPNVVDAERRLRAALGTPVKIVRRAAGAGRIQVSFKSDAELDRLFNYLTDAQRAVVSSKH